MQDPARSANAIALRYARPMQPQSTARARNAVAAFRNNTAVFLWVFAAVFLLMLGAMTYVFIRDGTPAGYSPIFFLAVMAFFWLGGAALAVFAASKHCLAVTVGPRATLLITRRFPFRTETRSVARSHTRPAHVIDSRDSEGSPYFYARATLADGTQIDLAESHSRESCAATVARFNGLLLE